MNEKEKAIAYDKALERANKLQKTCDNSAIVGWMEYIFPELRESEDERIRKGLIKAVSGTMKGNTLFGTNVTREEALAWLEKQGQVKESSISQHEIETCKENNDSLTSEDERIRKSIIKILKGEDTYTSNENTEEYVAWLEKQDKETSWKPSKEEMDVLYGLAYITNQYDEYKEEVITRLYQDLKREFFNGSSYENMFPNTEDGVRRRSTIQVLEYAKGLDVFNQYGKADIDKNIAWLEKQGEQKPILDFKARNWYVSIVDGKIHDLTYNPTDKKKLKKLTQSVLKTSDKEKGSEQIPANPEKIIKYEPKFKAGDKLISTKNPHLTYEIIDIEDNELGELDYKVIIYTDGKDGVTHNISCKNVDAWGELVKEKPAWSEEDERLCQCIINEQEEALNEMGNVIYGDSVIISDFKEERKKRVEWLKSLKERMGGK